MCVEDGFNNINIHKNASGKSRYVLKPGITVLSGCNGYGKTTTTEAMMYWLNNNGFKYFSFDGADVCENDYRGKCLLSNNFHALASFMSSSEGEQQLSIFTDFCKKTLALIDDSYDRSKPFILFIDAIDSGLSIDTVAMVRNYLFRVMHDIMKLNIDVYIIITSNTYEMCRSDNIDKADKDLFRCMDTYTFKDKRFKSYNAYAKFIMYTAEIVNARYSKEENN